MGQSVILNQFMVGQGDLNGVEVLTLDILDQGHLYDMLIRRCLDVGWNTFQTGHQGSSITTFTRNDEILLLANLFEGNRLDHAH